jgi:hypothetical protein
MIGRTTCDSRNRIEKNEWKIAPDLKAGAFCFEREGER